MGGSGEGSLAQNFNCEESKHCNHRRIAFVKDKNIYNKSTYAPLGCSSSIEKSNPLLETGVDSARRLDSR
jgi:hypothetical protein